MLSLVLTTLTVSAIPAKQGQWQIITLADGTTVRVQLRGDEHAHFWQDANGQNYVFDETQKAYKTADMRQLTKQALARRAQVDQHLKARRAARRADDTNGNFTGSNRGLIILAEFKDKKFAEENTRDFYERIANEENFTHEAGFNGSVHDYFKAQSRGAWDLTFDVVGPVKLKHEFAFYGRDVGGQGNDVHPDSMIVEACLAVADSVDFKDYDWNGDGEADQVFVLYAGPGQNNGGDSNTIWPHMYRLDAYDCTLTIDETIVNTYACSCELQPDQYNGWGGAKTWKIDGNGTICHEFSHCLGYPDMYDVNYGNHYGMSTWDLMDVGCYNDDGFRPCGYTGWERWLAGWLEPIELTGEMEVNDMTALEDGGDAYIVFNKGFEDEYYILENRQKTGWDSALGGSGLLIIHIDYDKELFDQNIVNATGQFEVSNGYYLSNDHERCTVFHANRAATRYTAKDDAYPHGFNNELTNTSKPAATVYNPNIDGSLFMNVSITNITQNNDSTMAFNFTDIPEEPVEQRDQTIEITSLPEMTYGDEAYQLPETTNEGLALTWTSSNEEVASISDNEIIIKKPGTTTITATQDGDETYNAFSVSFTLTVAKAQLTVTADDQTMVEGDPLPELTVSYEGFQYSDDITVLTKQATAKTSATSDSAPGTYTIRVSGAKADNYSMKYQSGTLTITERINPTGITQHPAPNTQSFYDLQGRLISNNLSTRQLVNSSTLKKGVYIVNGKKIVNY